MSYQVALNSRNVLAPVTLEGRDGARLNEPPSRLDTATAMVIAVSAEGSFSQDFIPLRIVTDSQAAYAGQEWELRAHAAGREHYVFYLGIPDRCFAAGPDGTGLKSLSIEVVGTSPMTGREDYSGGVDVTLQAQVVPPLIPGFLNLAERFLPALLPHNFVESYVLDVLEAAGRKDLVLMASLQADPAVDRVPVSFGKHWEPKNWVGAVVENLAGGADGYHVIRGGCFYARNRRVTHWFGAGIGLEDRGFRQAAGERIRALGPSGNGAWVFWLEPQGPALPSAEALAGLHKRLPQARFTVRHPMMHRLLSHRAPAASQASRAAAAASTDPASGRDTAAVLRLPAESAVAALAQVARILAEHQAELHRARTDPSHDLWSHQAAQSTAQAVAGALEAAEKAGGKAPGRAASVSPSLEVAVRELYRVQGETLRTLESVFDETSGYAAWDSPANPVRELIAAYLAEGAEARSTV